MSVHLLSCRDLSIAYGTGQPSVRDISFSIDAGECLALVGPSGSGKTTIARAILGLLPRGARTTGQLSFEGVNLLTLEERRYRNLRGKAIGYVAQDPHQACDPLQSVHRHIASAWMVHRQRPAPGGVRQRLDAVGIANVDYAMHQFPHQWSGGMLQRASIAAATAHAPRLLVADEPTSALDADRAHAIIAALKASGSAILLISHDFELVLQHADRIVLCDEGRMLGMGRPDDLRSAGRSGLVSTLHAATAPMSRPTRIQPGKPCLSAKRLCKTYHKGGHDHVAVDDCDITLHRGEILGISGASGCGKSTLLRLLAGMERPDKGILHRANDVAGPGAVMPVFQDPVASLNSRWPIWRSLTEPLTAPHLPRLGRAILRARALEQLSLVGLGAIDPECLPGELSSGQCQRVSVARALIARPTVILADEPTSALDTLAKRHVLDLLLSAVQKGAAVVLVSHDRKMLSQVADRVLLMHQGRIES